MTEGHDLLPRPRTWVEVTTKGRRAYRQHLLALRAITEGILDESD